MTVPCVEPVTGQDREQVFLARHLLSEGVLLADTCLASRTDVWQYIAALSRTVADLASVLHRLCTPGSTSTDGEAR